MGRMYSAIFKIIIAKKFCKTCNLLVYNGLYGYLLSLLFSQVFKMFEPV